MVGLVCSKVVVVVYRLVSLLVPLNKTHRVFDFLDNPL